jgi:GT2 family glycosyltransferase
MTSITLLCFNKLTLTRRCITAVLEAGYPLEQLHVIDNGSSPDQSAALRATYPDLSIHTVTPNAGFAGGFTHGLTAHFQTNPTVQATLFLTNDTEIIPGCLEACMTTADATGAGLVAPCLTFRKEPDRIDSIGGRFLRDTGTLQHDRSTHLPVLLERDAYIPGTALWISRDAFFTLGGTDIDYHMYWEDVDLSFRAHAADIPQARCYEARIRHGIGQTCHKKPLYTTFYYQRNRIRFCKRWLSPAEWSHVQPLIHQDLRHLLDRSIIQNDSQRQTYLQSLLTELDT